MVSAWRQRSLRLDLVHWDTKISISALLYRLYCFFSNGEKNKKWKVHFSFLNGDMAVSYSFVETSLQFTYQFSLYTSRGAVSISTFFHFTLTIRFLLSLFWRVFFFLFFSFKYFTISAYTLAPFVLESVHLCFLSVSTVLLHLSFYFGNDTSLLYILESFFYIFPFGLFASCFFIPLLFSFWSLL